LNFTRPLSKLIDEFQKFPGVGPKSAQRMAFHVLDMQAPQVKQLAATIVEAKDLVRQCSRCFNLSEQDPCEICTNPRRDVHTICVVAEPRDLIAIERTHEYKGLYHVLTSLISPLEGKGPEQLTIQQLVNRAAAEEVQEVILAINPTVEGDTTVLYLTQLLKPLNVKVTRIAFGLPMGSDLEYADDVTLCKAIEGRREL
jgi:recombination protein RecR